MEELGFAMTPEQKNWLEGLRVDLKSVLRRLGDIEYQKRVWIDGAPKGGKEDSFDEAVHFLYDDTCLGQDPSQAVGVFLSDEVEVDLIEEVIDALDKLFDREGLNRSDQEYVLSPLWGEVLRSARLAIETIDARESQGRERLEGG